MIVTKRGRPTRFTHKQFRRIVEWKSLKDTAEELGLTPGQADKIRSGYRYRQVSNERANIHSAAIGRTKPDKAGGVHLRPTEQLRMENYGF